MREKKNKKKVFGVKIILKPHATCLFVDSFFSTFERDFLSQFTNRNQFKDAEHVRKFSFLSCFITRDEKDYIDFTSTSSMVS